ncbi:MAG: hypothetical protein V4534_05375 [Myxococcota bacterium]
MFNQKTAYLIGLLSLVGHGLWAVQNAQFFPFQDLRPGMRGIGYTVFSSLKGIETFDVEILGRMENYVGPAQDLIIARVVGGPFEKSSVVAGMSGSPVYVDGKLIGALSYAFGNFTKDAIAGITPIANMVNKTGGMQPIDTGNQMRPIALPLVASGLSPLVAKSYASELSRRGFGKPIAGAGGFGSSSQNTEKLVAGGPFAAILVSGDMNLSALGTVTWTNGNEFVALGHPFLQNGVSELPVAGAYVVTTVFGQQEPYKMGQPTGIVGVLESDRSSGVHGFTGLKPRMMPLEVKINGKTWKYQIARTVRDTPFLASLAISNSLAMAMEHELGGTYELDVSARLSSGDDVRYRRMLSASGQPIEVGAVATFLEPLFMLQDQDFKKIEFNAITANIKHTDDVKNIRLIGLSLGEEPQGGQDLEVVLYAQPWKQSAKKYRGVMKWPALNWTGNYQVLALDRLGAMALEREVGISAEVTSYADILDQIRTMPTDTQVCLYAKQQTSVNHVLGYNLTDLPISFKETLTDMAAGTEVLFNSRAVRLGCMDLGAVVTGKVLKSYGEKRQS